MTEPLVRLRCGKGKCRQVMLEVYDAASYAVVIADAQKARDLDKIRRVACVPDELVGKVQAVPCPRHDSFRGGFIDEVHRRNRKGLDPKPQVTLSYIAWADLRHLLYLAATRGRCVDDTLNRQPE